MGDNSDLFELDADLREVIGNRADVLVFGPSRQDLVADDENGSCDVFRCTHGRFPTRVLVPGAGYRPRCGLDSGWRRADVQDLSVIALFFPVTPSHAGGIGGFGTGKENQQSI